MSFLPTDSAIKVDAALEEKLKGASFEEIKAHLANAAVEQRLVVPDVYDNSVLIPTELASAAPKKVGKVVVLNGVKHSLIADNEAGLLAAENALYRQNIQPATTVESAEQPRNERGQFTAEPVVSDEQKAALQLQFQLGQIDSATYLEQSGAIANYLEKQGIPLEDLKAAVAEKQSERFEQSWKEATEEFLHSAVGADWPGGENMNIAGRLIQENNLTDKPSVETLAAVWNHMKENGLAVETQEAKAHNRALEAERIISETNDPYALRNMLQPGSSMFGR